VDRFSTERWKTPYICLNILLFIMKDVKND
jgi:hypothetical protein